MDDLFTRIRATPLLIDHPLGGLRLAVAIFPHAEGILFFDVFWYGTPSFHPVHVVKGEVGGDGPWRIRTEDGEVTVRELVLGKDEDHWTEWNQWLEYLKSEVPDKDAYQRFLLKTAEEHGGIVERCEEK